MKYAICYSEPYSVYVSEEYANDNRMCFGDPITLKFKINNKNKEIHAEIKKLDEFNLQEEFHSMFYTICSQWTTLPEDLKKLFSKFKGEDERDIEIDYYHQLEDFFYTLNSYNKNRLLDNDIIIGCGFFEIFLKGERNLDNLIKNPFYQIDEATLNELLNEIFPSLISIKKYKGSIVEVDEIYFCTEELKPSDKQIQEIKRRISKIKYIDLSQDYIIPYHYIGAHGPLKKHVICNKISPKNRYLVNIREESIQFTWAFFGEISVKTKKERGNFKFDICEIKDTISNIFENMFKENIEYTLDDAIENRMILKIDDFIFSFILFDDYIYYDFLHSYNFEEDLNIFYNIIKKICKNIEAKFHIELDITGFNNGELKPEVDIDRWVWDTCALYLQTPHNDTLSITGIILNNWNFIGNKFVIPWQVLCEINRHKDENNSTARASKRGINNLKILNLFSQYGFLNLSIEKTQKFMDASVLPNTGGTDISIMNYSVEKNHDTGVITKDERLFDLCEISEIPVINVKNIYGFKDVIDSVKDIEFILKKAYEKNVFPSSKGDIIDFFLNELMKTEDRRGEKNINVLKVEAEKMLSNYLKKEKLIKYLKNDDFEYNIFKEVNLIPTYDHVLKIKDYIGKKNDAYYLNNEYLQKIRSCIGGLSKNEVPRITFVLPSSYIDNAFKNGDEKFFYKLLNIKNSHYECKIEKKSNDVYIDAINMAAERGYTIICEKGEELCKRASLFGLNIKEFK